MPRYHFDLVDSETLADKSGQELPDDTTAKLIAKQLAATLRDAQPALRNRNFVIHVIKQDGKTVCRVPLDPLH